MGIFKIKRQIEFTKLIKSYPKMIEYLQPPAMPFSSWADNGTTPLHFAVKKGYQDVVAWLIAKGADINAKDNAGLHSLNYVFSCPSCDRKVIAEWLLSKGAEVSVKSAVGGETTLHTAALMGVTDVAELLIVHGANVNDAENTDGVTPLHLAARYGYLDLANLLIASGAHVDVKDALGDTPLHVALKEGQVDFAEHLIAFGADVNLKNSLVHQTPLIIAIKKGLVQIAERLIERGADVNSTDSDGISPIRYALQRKNDKLAKILKEHGAQEPITKQAAGPEHEEIISDFQRAERSKPQYHQVIETSAKSWPFDFDNLSRALAIAERQDDLRIELLTPVLTLYQRTVKSTYYGKDYDEGMWDHVERFGRGASRKQFRESTIIEEMSLHVISKLIHLPGSNEVLLRIKSSMETSRNSYDPLYDDSPDDIASRASYSATIKLIAKFLSP